MKLTLNAIKADIGSVRGLHQIPLMPALPNSGISYFDDLPSVTCVARAMRSGCRQFQGWDTLTSRKKWAYL